MYLEMTSGFITLRLIRKVLLYVNSSKLTISRAYEHSNMKS